MLHPANQEKTAQPQKLAMPNGHDSDSAGPRTEVCCRVLAVDDHQVFREALQELIAAVPGFVCVGEGSSGEEALREVKRLLPQLVLIDVVMPGMGGIAAAREIQRTSPGVAVMLISVEDPLVYPGANALDDPVLCARKQDLGPKQLRRAWEDLGQLTGP